MTDLPEFAVRARVGVLEQIDRPGAEKSSRGRRLPGRRAIEAIHTMCQRSASETIGRLDVLG
jgi:hypothetical protein